MTLPYLTTQNRPSLHQQTGTSSCTPRAVSLCSSLLPNSCPNQASADLETDARPILFAHTSAPVALATHPTSWHHFVAACQDGVVRLWDARSSKHAIASFNGFTDPAKKKIVSIDWGFDNVVVTGGEGGIALSRAAVN